MKRFKTLAIILLASLSYLGHTQGIEADLGVLDFYQRMAISDALYEETLSFTSEEDEADYWKDQLNFEKQLKEVAYSAYKTYIFYKRKAYLDHQQDCDIARFHGKGYNKQASFYGIHGLRSAGREGDVTKNIGISSNLASKQN